MPRSLWAGLLRRMTQQDIQQAAVTLINRNHQAICQTLTAQLNRRGLRCRLTELVAIL